MANQPDRNHAIERLLREARSSAAVAAAGPCVTAEELAAWLDRGLAEAEAAKVEAHLATCPACQALLGAYAATEPAADARSRTWTRAVLPFAAAAVVVIGVWVAGTRWAGQSLPGTPVERQMARLEEPSVAPVPPAQAREPGPPPRVPQRGGVVVAGPKQTPPVKPPAPEARADQPSADLADLKVRANAPAATREREAAPAPQVLDRPATLERTTVSAAPRAEFRAVEEPPAAQAPQVGANARGDVERDRARQELAAAAPAPPPPARAERFSTAAARLATAPVAKAADARVAISSPDSWRWRIVGAALEVSSDGGAMWLPATGITPVDLADVTSGASPGRGVSWLVGRGGLVLVTADGRRFTRAMPPAAVPLTRVRPVDASTADVQAANGRTWRTTDGGRTWAQIR